jgi:hypothetical protein
MKRNEPNTQYFRLLFSIVTHDVTALTLCTNRHFKWENNFNMGLGRKIFKISTNSTEQTANISDGLRRSVLQTRRHITVISSVIRKFYMFKKLSET